MRTRHVVQSTLREQRDMGSFSVTHADKKLHGKLSKASTSVAHSDTANKAEKAREGKQMPVSGRRAHVRKRTRSRQAAGRVVEAQQYIKQEISSNQIGKRLDNTEW